MNHKVDISYLTSDGKDFAILGTVNWNQATTILQQIQSHKPEPNACFQILRADLHCTTGFQQAPGSTSELDLQYMFEPYVSKCTPCMVAGTALPLTNKAMIEMCARKFRCGKCQDKFMRETFGTVLFPQFYANQKVK